MKEIFNKAFEIACEAHKGQLDKAGMPYILHPIRVSEKFEAFNLKTVAILHDVIEDSNITGQDLKDKGIPSYIIVSVQLLTKNRGEDYVSYLQRLNSDFYARTVKIEDLKDNIDTLRLSTLTDKDIERVRKYHGAYNFLKK